MQQRKNFITIKENFTCGQCKTENPPAKGTCRNHCRECLSSKHVDATIPGDRKSECKGLMRPKKIEGGTNRKGYLIIHQCEKCGKTIRNKMASDDSMETVILISTNNAKNL